MWNPWNWVKAGWDFSFGGIKQLYQWVLTTIGQIYDYINGWVQWLQDAITNAIRYAANLGYAIEQWAQSWYTYIIGLAKSLIAQVMTWTLNLWNQLWSYIKEAWDFAHWVYSYVTGLIYSLINSVYEWVVRNIWDPIWNYITGMYKSLTQWINYLLKYIEHPELLAALLGTYLLKTWLSLAKRFAVPLARWWMRTMMSLVGEFYDIIETILANIL